MSEDAKVDHTVLAERIERIATDVSDIKEEMKRIAAGMERIARLEERHVNSSEAIARAFTRIENHERRLVQLEVEVPITKMVRNWVIMGVLGVLSLLGAQVFTIVFYVSRNFPQ